MLENPSSVIKSSGMQSPFSSPNGETSASQRRPASVFGLDYDRPPPGYTRRLIPMIGIPADEVDENFDEVAWFKKLYGPDIIVVKTTYVPKEWVLVDGISISI
jgi:hypothetical protein